MKNYNFPLLIGGLLLVVGMVLTILDFYRFEYLNTLPEMDLSIREIEIYERFDDKEFRFNKKTALVNIIEDPCLEEDELLIKIIYYNDFATLSKTMDETFNYKKLNIELNYDDIVSSSFKKVLTKGFINLRQGKIYNYSLLFKPTIDVYVNKNDYKRIKIMNY